MSHCIIVTVGAGIDKAHVMSTKENHARLPLTLVVYAEGQQAVVSMEDGGVSRVVRTRRTILFLMPSVVIVGVRQ